MIHDTIKRQLATAGKPVVEIYGEVYWRAWRAAEEPILSHLEYGCVQDLMNRAVHAAQPSSFKQQSAAHKIRRILDCFHAQKKHPEACLFHIACY